jgi:rare lipoprotein A
MRHSSSHSLANAAVTLPTRRLLTFVTVVALAVVALPRPVGAEVSLTEIRAQRSVLVRRIAALTDQATRLQSRAATAQERRAVAGAVAEDARRHVARYAVDTYLASVTETQAQQQRHSVFTSVTTRTARFLFGQLDHARKMLDAEADTAHAALASAQRVLEELRVAREQLERTIAERVEAERASVAARRKATASSLAKLRPAFARTTRSQAELFARYPFGPVSGIPPGLAATGVVITGKASWYGPGFDGRPTASGAIFDQEGWTVASRDLPLGTMLLITRGDRAVLALVNDRGPFVAGRVLDLSHGVANALGTVQAGVATVTATVLVPTG